ncbi:Angiogenic factor with G patch and FHA domains 1 [Smittium culicis]|uniref:Angiogenic factor with G patch and FHA domains 1 n=1 Tax=Smittium culicis TaxID=133412 RepID=A0A1R1YB33_9FUNG|nr:Angiogenic factor with G patch and FHA domains 1 [Smittium culicis]
MSFPSINTIQNNEESNIQTKLDQLKAEISNLSNLTNDSILPIRDYSLEGITHDKFNPIYLADDQIPANFQQSAEPRYYYNHETGIWYDSIDKYYSYFDELSHTYIPIQESKNELQSLEVPESNSNEDYFMRLVVINSDVLEKGHVIDVANKELYIGREKNTSLANYLRINDINTSKIHAQIFFKERKNNKALKSKLKIFSSGVEYQCISNYEEHDISNLSNSNILESSILSFKYNDLDQPSQSKEVEPGPAQKCTFIDENKTVLTQNPTPNDSLKRSKKKKKVENDEIPTGFYIVDCGSTLGTYLNEYRLSNSKESSKPSSLLHMDIITIGSSAFKVHIHSGLPCSNCSLSKNSDSSEKPQIISSEPIIFQCNTASVDSINKSKSYALSPESIRREELNRLKNNSYIDRAHVRRVHTSGPSVYDYNFHISNSNSLSGSVTENSQDHLIENTLKSHLSTDNKGYKLLTSMGWKKGTGLGSFQNGTTEPIPVSFNHSRGGLGSGKIFDISVDQNLARKKARINEESLITRQRFFQNNPKK